MPKFIKLLLSFVCLFFVISVVPVQADYTFVDPISGSLSSSWLTIPGHITPAISTSDGREYARFYQGSSNSYAYLGHSGASNVTSSSFDFYYTQESVTQGAGFMLTDIVPITSQVPPNDSGHYFVGIWNIGTKYYLLSPTCDNVGGCGLPVYSRAIFELPSDIWNTISIVLHETNVDIILNGSVRTLPIGAFALPTGAFFGNPEITVTSQNWSDFFVDNFSITYFSPTPPPTPTFPYLSQKNSLWASQEYDSASDWAPIDKRGIDRWGCAITSVAMILQNYGVRALDGTAVDPSKLDTWLKSQPDGYVGPGLLNWLAVTRYAKESYAAGHADTKLEFVRTTAPTTPTLPAIFGLGGHFVVAHGTAGLNWQINDPANSLITTLPLTTTLQSVNRYIPSLTDLSYMLFVAEPGMTITMTDSGGEDVPLQWLSESLDDDIDGSSSSPTIQTGLVSKPADGVYTLHVQNTGSESAIVETYLYDIDGGVAQDTLAIPGETNADFAIQYSSTPNSNGPIALDYTSIFSYLKSLRVPKSSANGIFESLLARFTDVSRTLGVNQIANLNTFIAKQSPKFITPEVKTKLQNYILLIQQN